MVLDFIREMEKIQDALEKIEYWDIALYQNLEEYLNKKYGEWKWENILKDLKKEWYIAEWYYSWFVDIPDWLTLNPLTLTVKGHELLQKIKRGKKSTHIEPYTNINMDEQKKNFFERNAWLWWFVSIIVAVVLGIVTLCLL